jgi:hypothetical protein
MLWILLIALLAVWVIGSISVTSLGGGAALLAAMAAVVAAVGFWERHHHSS